MARPLRIPLAGGAYHVFARGNGKQAVFLDDRDHQIFLDLLVGVLSRFSWQCLAYCLMPNHYHLIVRTRRADLSQGMRQLNGVYAQRFNRRHDRAGHVFQGRFGATLVQAGEHLLEAIRYVVLNPVRAGLVERIDDWPWTSQRELLGLSPPRILSSAELLALFGSGTEAAASRYLEFIAAGDHNARFASGPVAGDAGFTAMHLPDGPSGQEIPFAPWRETRPSLDELLDTDDLDRGIAEAYRVHRYTMREIAEFLGCHYATVSRRLKKFEEAHRG